MKLFLSFVFVFIFSGTVQAQFYGRSFSSTLEEGIQRGYADVVRSVGRYLEGLGTYENMHEEARSKRIDNWSKSVQTQWEIQDEKKRRQSENNYIKRWTKRLDDAEARHALQQREDGLQAEGVLPPKKKIHTYTTRGRTYASFEDWLKTADHYLFRLERAEQNMMKEIRKTMDERRDREATSFLAWWNKQDMVSRDHYTHQKSLARVMNEPQPVRPKPKFPDLEMKIESQIKVLDQIRAEQDKVKSIMKTKGNIAMEHKRYGE